VLTLTSGLAQLRPHYNDETRDLFRVLVNATSAAEANLALDVLRQLVPEKPLVTACNLREVLRALPSSPFTMRVDEATLQRTARLDRHIAALRKELPGNIELIVTTAGNLVLDIIVKHDGRKYFWTPVPVVDDYVNPEVVDLVVTSGYLLDEVIDLAKCMGVVFNPKFYLSLEDWCMEYAADVMQGIDDLF
jgi:quinol monooxygenase YgiN